MQDMLVAITNCESVSLIGARQAVCSGEEIPHLDRREKFPKAQQQHERGETPHAF